MPIERQRVVDTETRRNLECPEMYCPVPKRIFLVVL